MKHEDEDWVGLGKRPRSISLFRQVGRNSQHPVLERVGECIVDEADFPILSISRWRLSVKKAKDGSGLKYAFRWGKDSLGRATKVFMHREILGLLPGDKRKVSHRDKDGLNNQRSNLLV